MKIHFLSFASSGFYKSLNRIENETKHTGFFDTVTCLKSHDLPLKYRFKHLLSLNRFTRGYGYWMWKSFVVKVLLNKIEYGDILLYADAGCTINIQGETRFKEYIDMLTSSRYSTICFQSYFTEKQYTKGDLLKYFEVEKNDEIKNSYQLIGTAFFIKKDEQSIKLVDEWYTICHNKKGLIDDSVSKYPNDPAFIDHRHDQSVFSLLGKLRGSLIIPDETYFYDWEEKKSFPIHAKRIRL